VAEKSDEWAKDYEYHPWENEFSHKDKPEKQMDD